MVSHCWWPLVGEHLSLPSTSLTCLLGVVVVVCIVVSGNVVVVCSFVLALFFVCLFVLVWFVLVFVSACGLMSSLKLSFKNASTIWT